MIGYIAHLQSKAKLGFYNNELNFCVQYSPEYDNVQDKTEERFILPTRLSTVANPDEPNYSFDGKFIVFIIKICKSI